MKGWTGTTSLNVSVAFSGSFITVFHLPETFGLLEQLDIIIYSSFRALWSPDELKQTSVLWTSWWNVMIFSSECSIVQIIAANDEGLCYDAITPRRRAKISLQTRVNTPCRIWASISTLNYFPPAGMRRSREVSIPARHAGSDKRARWLRLLLHSRRCNYRSGTNSTAVTHELDKKQELFSGKKFRVMSCWLFFSSFCFIHSPRILKKWRYFHTFVFALWIDKANLASFRYYVHNVLLQYNNDTCLATAIS